MVGQRHYLGEVVPRAEAVLWLLADETHLDGDGAAAYVHQQVGVEAHAVVEEHLVESQRIAGGHHLPGNYIGMVFGLIDEYLIAFPHAGFSEGKSKQVGRGSGSRRKHDFGCIRSANELRNGSPGVLEFSSGQAGDMMHRTVDIGIHPGGHFRPLFNDTYRPHGCGRAVQIDKRLAIYGLLQFRELRPDPIECHNFYRGIQI